MLREEEVERGEGTCAIQAESDHLYLVHHTEIFQPKKCWERVRGGGRGGSRGAGIRFPVCSNTTFLLVFGALFRFTSTPIEASTVRVHQQGKPCRHNQSTYQIKPVPTVTDGDVSQSETLRRETFVSPD